MFNFQEFLSNIKSIYDSRKFSDYIESSFGELESFFATLSINDLNDLKFDCEDLLYDLVDNKLIDEKNETVVDAFLILLAEQFEQANLINAIKLIHNYLPESAIKYRLEAAMLYLRVNDLTVEYHNRFSSILDLIVKSQKYEEYQYKVTKSILNYFFTAIEQFVRVQNKELANSFKNLFVENKTRYKVLDDPFILDTINKVNIDNYKTLIDTFNKQIDTFSFSDVSCNISTEISNTLKETSEYADRLYTLKTPCFGEIIQISFDYIQNIGDPQILHTKLNQGVVIINDEKLLYKYLRRHK